MARRVTTMRGAVRFLLGVLSVPSSSSRNTCSAAASSTQPNEPNSSGGGGGGGAQQHMSDSQSRVATSCLRTTRDAGTDQGTCRLCGTLRGFEQLAKQRSWHVMGPTCSWAGVVREGLPARLSGLPAQASGELPYRSMQQAALGGPYASPVSLLALTGLHTAAPQGSVQFTSAVTVPPGLPSPFRHSLVLPGQHTLWQRHPGPVMDIASQMLVGLNPVCVVHVGKRKLYVNGTKSSDVQGPRRTGCCTGTTRTIPLVTVPLSIGRVGGTAGHGATPLPPSPVWSALQTRQGSNVAAYRALDAIRHTSTTAALIRWQLLHYVARRQHYAATYTRHMGRVRTAWM